MTNRYEVPANHGTKRDKKSRTSFLEDYEGFDDVVNNCVTDTCEINWVCPDGCVYASIVVKRVCERVYVSHVIAYCSILTILFITGIRPRNRYS